MKPLITFGVNNNKKYITFKINSFLGLVKAMRLANYCDCTITSREEIYITLICNP